MNFIKFEFVEDYLEVLAGKRDPFTRKQQYHGFKPIVSLARYDVSVVDSISDRALRREPLSEKQAALVCSILLKYRKQLRKCGIEVSPVEAPKYRLPLVKSDSTKRLWADGDVLKLKFPYVQDLINSIRTMSRDSHGSVTFNKDSKVWEMELTEFNLSWSCTFAQMHKFEIDERVLGLMDELIQIEEEGYKIELFLDGDKLAISNAEDSLIKYVEEHLGGFAVENVQKLVDYSGILGYTVHEKLVGVVQPHEFTQAQEVVAKPFEIPYSEIFHYIKETKRFPAMIYLNNYMGSKHFKELAKEFFDESEIYEVKTASPSNPGYKYNPPEGTKIIFTNRVLKWYEHMNEPYKLFVSTQRMLYGADKSLWLSNAERIIYYTQE